jgi:hypothetical protein
MASAPSYALHPLAEATAPRKPYVLGAWLAYDPHETLEQFFVRRANALQAGDQAWRAGKIKAHHQKLYERLVDAVGAHQYCWVKVETLAAEFKANESTIKRWLTALEHAQLIRRQRQFKSSSRTYLVAYDQWQAPVARDGDEPQRPPAASEPPSTASVDEQCDEPPAAARNTEVPTPRLFFLSAMMPLRTAHLCHHMLRICHLTPRPTLLVLMVVVVHINLT